MEVCDSHAGLPRPPYRRQASLPSVDPLSQWTPPAACRVCLIASTGPLFMRGNTSEIEDEDSLMVTAMSFLTGTW